MRASALLDRDDQRRLAHLVGRVDLGAEPEQPPGGILEADPGSRDQRRVAVACRPDWGRRPC